MFSKNGSVQSEHNQVCHTKANKWIKWLLKQCYWCMQFPNFMKDSEKFYICTFVTLYNLWFMKYVCHKHNILHVFMTRLQLLFYILLSTKQQMVARNVTQVESECFFLHARLRLYSKSQFTRSLQRSCV